MKSKTVAAVSLIIFAIAAAAIISAGFTASKKTASTPRQLGVSTSAAPTQTVLTLTPAEIARHNSASDCWTIISGQVYNLTSYLSYHPGGVDIILPSCGADGTVAFQTRGGTGTHSSYADSLLSQYLVSSLNSSLSASESAQPSGFSPPPTAPFRKSRGEED